MLLGIFLGLGTYVEPFRIKKCTQVLLQRVATNTSIL